MHRALLAHIIRVGVYATAFVPLLVWSGFLFPFVSVKGFAFRFAVEFLFFLWLALALYQKEYRPRAHALTISMVVLVVVSGISALVGVNPSRSFWSYLERMHGVIDLLHLGAYFFIISSVFRTTSERRLLLVAFATAGGFVTLFGLGEILSDFAATGSLQRIGSTLGNASFLAGYLLFNLFILTWLYREVTGKNARRCIAALGTGEVVLLVATGTRGAVLALTIGVLVYVVWYMRVVFCRVSLKRIALYGSVVVLLFVGFSWFVAHNTAVSELPVIGRYVKITDALRGDSPRLLVWRIAWKGFKERPMLGWGPENFISVFNQNYDPRLGSEEAFFDRAHNIFLDWLVTGGIIGLIAYLCVLGSALFSALQCFGRTPQSALFFCFFVTYLVHTFFVFDTGASFITLFALMGFIESERRAREHDALLSRHSHKQKEDKRFRSVPLPTYAIPLCMVCALVAAYFSNYKALYAGYWGARALRAATTGDARSTEWVDRALSTQSFATRDILFGAGEIVKKQIAEKLVQQSFAERIARALRERIADDPDDLTSIAQFSIIAIGTGHPDEAATILEAGLARFPTKQSLLFAAIEYHIARGNAQKAFEVARYTYELDPRNTIAMEYLVASAILDGKSDYAERMIAERGNEEYRYLPSTRDAYARVGNYEKVQEIWLKFIERFPNDPRYRLNAAATSLKLGNRDRAVELIEDAIRINPPFAPQGNELIRAIRAGVSADSLIHE